MQARARDGDGGHRAAPLVCVLSWCAAKVPTPTRPVNDASIWQMDDVALRYLLLGLRLGRHVPGFVASYSGPDELSEAVDGEPLTPPAELHNEAMQLAGIAAELPRETAVQRRRASWLAAQVGAMGALARRVGGEEIGYVDLVEELYDIELQLEPDATFETARRMLDSALPGGEPLRQRLAAHEATALLPPQRVLGMAAELSARLRMRTRAQLWLPERESLRFEAAHEVPWTLDARYLGGGSSVIRINLDRPISLAALVEIAAHEGYPGHHAEASVRDEVLVSAGCAELALVATLSPQALISEGMAVVAREVILTDQEHALELRRITRSLDQRLDVEVELMVQRARRLLSPALGNAAVALQRDGEPLRQVRSYLAEVALVGDDRLDEAISRLADPILGTEPFTHIEGRRLVSEWLEVHGQTHGYARLMAEQQTPATLRSELRPL